LERKGFAESIAEFAGEQSRNSRMGQQKRKQRFVAIVLETPSIMTERAAELADIHKSTAHKLRQQIVAEHGEHYAAPKRPKDSMVAQAKRLLGKMALSVDAYAQVGIDDIDPAEVDLNDEETIEAVAVILKGLGILTDFAEKLDRRIQQAAKEKPTTNVIPITKRKAQ
jgi:hypothetical protein